jgi:cysteine desulfurase / selenocysteine lyase
LLCEQTGASLKIIPMNERGELDLEVFEKHLNKRTKLLALAHVSNAIGTINPIKQMISLAHQQQVAVLIDGAQALPHMRVDVKDLDCDFYVFSGHKIYAPTGIGVLYAKQRWLEEMPPYQGGGEMISRVSFKKTTYNDIPYKFEAGTPHIAGAIGLAVALDYLRDIGMDKIQQHEQQLLMNATDALNHLSGVRIIGQAKHKAGIISFTLQGVHPHDLATICDTEGIAIRAGHHCAMPLMEYYKVPATARISFALYNTLQDIEQLMIGLQKAQEVFK